MQRKIFYTRRSKRPFIILVGLATMCGLVFSAGVYAGSMHPDLFAFGPTAPVAKVASADF
jgi:hypothetical protein